MYMIYLEMEPSNDFYLLDKIILDYILNKLLGYFNNTQYERIESNE